MFEKDFSLWLALPAGQKTEKVIVDSYLRKCFDESVKSVPIFDQNVTKNSAKKPNETFIKFHLPLKLKQQLEQLANEKSISISSLMRVIATEYIKNKG